MAADPVGPADGNADPRPSREKNRLHALRRRGVEPPSRHLTAGARPPNPE